MRVLITGSSGLIGSEAVEYFDRIAERVVGVDNNMRRDFFGPGGDTTWNLKRLLTITKNFEHHDLDIRDRARIGDLMRTTRPDLIIHCAAQPSHDLARMRPLDDFDVNAVGTVNLLEACRQHAAGAVFVFLSTNKVYGDTPNELPLVEMETRFDYARPGDRAGIDETCRIDHCLHSIFGASKVAADIMVQEYGRYYGMATACLRGGCLTGPNHSGVELHGFLAYLVKCAMTGAEYTIYGYKGKQVRDNIHSLDVVRACEEIFRSPRPGEVYNLGGGRANSVSILEAVEIVYELTGRRLRTRYVDRPRDGDHICYITNLQKLRNHYPRWDVTVSLRDIFKELIAAHANGDRD